jgi:hypothetical protein
MLNNFLNNRIYNQNGITFHIPSLAVMVGVEQCSEVEEAFTSPRLMRAKDMLPFAFS